MAVDTQRVGLTLQTLHDLQVRHSASPVQTLGGRWG